MKTMKSKSRDKKQKSIEHVPPSWKVELAQATLHQVQKDLALQGLHWNADLAKPMDLESAQASLSSFLRKHEGEMDQLLPRLLYQVDVRETSIPEILSSGTDTDSFDGLAAAIVKRCFEKACWKRLMSEEKEITNEADTPKIAPASDIDKIE